MTFLLVCYAGSVGTQQLGHRHQTLRDAYKLCVWRRATVDVLSQRKTRYNKPHVSLQEYEDVAAKKQKAVERTAQLEEHKALLQSRREMLKEQLAERQQSHAGKQRQLQERPEYNSVQKLEQRMKALAQNNFQISEMIKARESENNYKGLAKKVGSLANELNDMVIKAAAAL